MTDERKTPEAEVESLDLPLLLYQIGEALDTLEGSLQSGADPHNVEVGAYLLKIRERCDALQEKVKAELRVAALSETDGEPGTVEFHGHDQGYAKVTVPANRAILQRGTTPHDIERALSGIIGGREATDLVHQLFTTRVVVKPKALTVLETSTDAARRYLMGAFKIEGSTPRVSFKLAPRSEPDE